MIERENNTQIIDMVGLFGERLAQWDKRIIEIIAVGDLAKGVVPPTSPIQLICSFYPEPMDSSVGFFTTLNLLMRDDFEHVSEQLGITNPIDLGFKMGDKVYLPNGVVLNTPSEQIMVWPQYARCEPSKTKPFF